MTNNNTNRIVCNHLTGKYGVKKANSKDWWIKPIYDAIQGQGLDTCREAVWVKKDGRFGFLDVIEKKEVVPCEYGFPIYFVYSGYAEAWKDYKAGVIDRNGKVVVPIIYDELQGRYETVDVPDEEKHTIILEDGTEKKVGPNARHVFRGFAGFTNDGKAQAYDENMQPCEFADWEKYWFDDDYQWCEPENATRSAEEIEERIREEYVRWRKMAGGMPYTHACHIDSDEADEQRQKVINLVYDRRYKMNKSWVHNKENADRIMRTNNLLNRAVEKAVRLGRKTAKYVEWMNKVPNLDGYCYETEVFVYPQWTNSKSEVGYKSVLSKSKERDKLIEEENDCHNHIWNIIAAMNDCFKVDGVGACFYHSATSGDAKEWNLKELLMDDGQSWDELIHYPAYMDCYFLVPFHHLYCDLYNYAFEDLARMNDFRVRVNVKLETKEKS